MVTCPACSIDNSETSKFCSQCGVALTPEYAATVTHEAAADSDKSCNQSSQSDSSHDRFFPGTKLADRYRIVSLIGKGGMGEVYRADDLKLGHPVALKFLPRELANDESRLDYFHSEVRLSRQISHPNVCRVHDIGEVDGQHFLSMEYIDGEDLRGLLRRIGRLPKDKGVEISQQLCSGLTAAHNKGVLHRDLKPANIMIDGRGQVRITDFGLAQLASDGVEGEVAGTPSYMAPEQLARGEATIQSDLYSLGLIFYEMFTGERVYKTGSRIDLIQAHEDSSLRNPSDLIDDMDSAVELVILKCLEREPYERPKSAANIAAALPGVNPLAAALAAGKTPSPDMVAAAGDTDHLHPTVGAICLAAILLLLSISPWLIDQSTAIGRAELEMKPDVLEDRAKVIIHSLGYESVVPGNSSYRLAYDDAYLESTADDLSAERNQNGSRGAALYFWYRQSPQHLVVDRLLGSGRVTLNDPPQTLPGDVSVCLDLQGRLLELQAIPPEKNESIGTSPGVDWLRVLELAGLEMVDLQPNDPVFNPPVYADHRLAWKGVLSNDQTIHVEAASYGGRPVFFQILWPDRGSADGRRPSFHRNDVAKRNGAVAGFQNAVYLFILFVAVLLARRNLRHGRGDRKGASKVALFVFSMFMLGRLLGASHVPHLGAELGVILNFAVVGIYLTVYFWLIYLALEPYVRRFWPESLISWTRILTGRIHDPRIGRDILIGVLFAVSLTIVNTSTVLLVQRLGGDVQLTRGTDPSVLMGSRYLASEFFFSLLASLGAGLIYLFMMLLSRVLCRNTWLAVSVFVLIQMTPAVLSNASYVRCISAGILGLTMAYLLTRYGLFSFMAAVMAGRLLGTFPITADASSWYFGSSLFALTTVTGLAVYSLYISLVGRLPIIDRRTTV